MYRITITRIATGEHVITYTNPFPMSDAAVEDLARVGLAAVAVCECVEHVTI